MVKIEAPTLEEAYKKASSKLRCSAAELKVEVIQKPSPGVFGIFKKNAIIIAAHNPRERVEEDYEEDYEEEYDVPVEVVSAPPPPARKEKRRAVKKETAPIQTSKREREREVKRKQPVYEDVFEPEVEEVPEIREVREVKKVNKVKKRKPVYETKDFDEIPEHRPAPRAVPQKRVVAEKRAEVKFAPKKRERVVAKRTEVLNDTIMPASFVSDQDDEYDELNNGVHYTADYDDEYDNTEEVAGSDIQNIADSISAEINNLFDLTCFNIDSIDVTPYNQNTVLVNFKGSDSALLIGKEGYRYKAISYMIFNWINAKYDVQLRLEIAEFLQNQEDSVDRYLLSVQENVAKDGRAQTKILDGVLIQIALRKLRDVYPDKYVVIRSTRDGLKYIIINDYHSK